MTGHIYGPLGSFFWIVPSSWFMKSLSVCVCVNRFSIHWYTRWSSTPINQFSKWSFFSVLGIKFHFHHYTPNTWPVHKNEWQKNKKRERKKNPTNWFMGSQNHRFESRPEKKNTNDESPRGKENESNEWASGRNRFFKPKQMFPNVRRLIFYDDNA